MAIKLQIAAAIDSIVAPAKLNGLNQRAYLEWVLTEMPKDGGLGEPGHVDLYLPCTEDVPENCRLSAERADEPIVDAEALKYVMRSSSSRARLNRVGRHPSLRSDMNVLRAYKANAFGGYPI